MKTTERQLRAYVRRMLTEDEGGGEYADLAVADAGGPYGTSFGSGDDLYKIFVKPFTDVLNTAAGKTKELSQRAQGLAKVALEAVATTLVPFLRDDYAKIFAHEKEELAKVKEEYADVYRANWDAFKDNDVLAAAFFYSPSAFITADLARKSPQVAATLISVLSGGTLDNWLKRVAAKFKQPGTSHANEPVHGEGGPIVDAHLREAGEQPQQPADVAQVLGGKKLQQKLASMPKVRQMQQQGQSIVRGSLEKVYKEAKGVLQAHNLQQLQQALHKPIKGADKVKQLPPQERQAAEEALMKATRTGIKDFYVQQLQAQAKKATDAGVSDQHPYVRDVLKVAGKIKSL